MTPEATSLRPVFVRPHPGPAPEPVDPTASEPVLAAPPSADPAELRRRILSLTAEYAQAVADRALPFVPGRSPVPFAGRVYDEAEMVNLVESSLEFWLTEGRYAHRLEAGLARTLGVAHCRLVNSGSSANLLAFAALTSPRLGDRRVRRGDEVITVAAGFPTTVAPAIQMGAIPVFVDVDPRTANVDVSRLEAAVGPRTRAVMLAHTLGNPFDVDAVVEFCRRHDLWLVEDNCDALGSFYTTRLAASALTRPTGSFGHLATSSFYPAHHMTTGEGGAVFTQDPELDAIVASLRDWGRDCYCRSGRDNTCGKRFDQCFGDLPEGYDHKYVYSHFGYNLKMTDLQASVGLAQLDKLADFGRARRANFAYLHRGLEPFAEVLDLPRATAYSDPSWFGFLMTVRPESPFSRRDIVTHLESARIQTRSLFAGNLIRHPCFDEMRSSGTGYRVVGGLEATDALMDRAFWIGVYPGMTAAHLDHMIGEVAAFCRRHGFS